MDRSAQVPEDVAVAEVVRWRQQWCDPGQEAVTALVAVRRARPWPIPAAVPRTRQDVAAVSSMMWVPARHVYPGKSFPGDTQMYHHSDAEMAEWGRRRLAESPDVVGQLRQDGANLWLDALPLEGGWIYQVTANGNHRSVLWGALGAPYLCARVTVWQPGWWAGLVWPWQLEALGDTGVEWEATPARFHPGQWLVDADLTGRSSWAWALGGTPDEIAGRRVAFEAALGPWDVDPRVTAFRSPLQALRHRVGRSTGWWGRWSR